MPQMNEKARSLDKVIKWLLLVMSVATLAVLVVAALKENYLADWTGFRKEYARILEDKAVDARAAEIDRRRAAEIDRRRAAEIARQFDFNMQQYYLPDLGSIDRCTTCHTGLEDPRMADQPQPFSTHPGKYLYFHDPSKFGCTICHQGQGRATEIADAHGRVPFWDHPLLDKRYSKTACSRCHSDEELFGPEQLIVKADEPGASPGDGGRVARGRDLYLEQGCLGCHALGGKGGTLSLDITFEGDKTHHELDFSHFSKDEPRHVAHWHRKHFMKPAEVAPGTVMPDSGPDPDDADALTAYTLSLHEPAPASFHRKPNQGPPEPGHGDELYLIYCSACHGTDGREEEAPGISTPALNNFDSLAVADDNYYRFIIANGRSGTNMTPWKAGSGNLSRVEIDRIVEHIREWEPAGATVGDVDSRLGDVRKGRAYYQGLCASCHGRRGEGGIGNILNSMSFLAVVSDAFLAETTIGGRPGTAMPSWKHLPAQGVSDILSYLRAWQPDTPSWDAVRSAMSSMDTKDNARIGRHLYQANCAGCHGPGGNGGIGLNLNSPDVLSTVDDEYLYRNIASGRPSTAMPAWRHLSADDMGAIITFVRSWQKRDRLELAAPPPPGDYTVGEIHYETSCLRCHGENGRGGVGPQLANPVLLAAASDATLFHWIGRGRTGTVMKGFLSDEHGPTRLEPAQIADVIAYLRREALADERPLLRTGVGNPALGAQLFKGNCVSCHGPDGEGASGPQLNNPAFLRSASDGFLSATIALGRTGTPMQSMIHGQEGLGQISPEQVQDLIAHMRLWDVPDTWRRPRTMAELSDRAILTGGENYAGYCASCHGPNGRGAQEGAHYFAPSLNNPEFLEAASDGFLLATIARGRSGTPMRPFGRGSGGIVSLPSGEITDIVSFIRTWQKQNRSAINRKTSKGGSLP